MATSMPALGLRSLRDYWLMVTTRPGSEAAVTTVPPEHMSSNVRAQVWGVAYEEAVMLVVFSGLPGTGKTTIARRVAARRAAVFLRIDVIEQALRHSDPSADFGPLGYAIAQAVAASNLANGQIVIADCVNPVRESRQAWRAIASDARTKLLEIEIICSDPAEHRRRVQNRSPDIDGLVYPTWQEVLDRDYDIRTEPRIIVDTAQVSPDDAVAVVERAMDI